MTEKKSIYAKLAEARTAFHKADLKKSGHNKFANYRYFELPDIVPQGLKCLDDAGLVPKFDLEEDRAVFRIIEKSGDGTIEFVTPRAAANLKGCHPVQNLGAEITYLRRYLWVDALEIIEHDAVDASQGAEPAEKISESQVADLEAKIAEVGADAAKFVKWTHSQFGAADLSQLTTAQYPQVVAMLEKKARAA